MGCYIFKDTLNLDPTSYGAYFVLRTEDNESFVALSKFSVTDTIGIESLHISELNADWLQHFAAYNYPGGECKSVLRP